MSKQIEFITRTDLGKMLGISKAAVSFAVTRDKKLRDVKNDGKTGININDPMTYRYVAEICSKKNIPLPPEFQEEKSDVQLFMEAVDNAFDEILCDDCKDLKQEFQMSVVEYVKREKED